MPLPQAATILTIVMMVGIIFPAPFYLHRFWNETDWYLRLSEFAHLMKDLSLAGAALLLLSGRLVGF